MFYTYEQNNICGKIIINKGLGIAKYVIIEALTTQQADKIAIKRGLYFDGGDLGLDCSCCGGDRWERASVGYYEPTINNKLVNIVKANYPYFNVYIHYLNHTRIKGCKPTSTWLQIF